LKKPLWPRPRRCNDALAGCTIARLMALSREAMAISQINNLVLVFWDLTRPRATEVNAPPAERVASGSPLEGGKHVGKAPKGLL